MPCFSGDGLRASKTVGTTTTTYTWDVAAGLPVVLQDGTYSYVYGAGGQLISQTDAAGTQSYLLADGLGSTRAQTDAAGGLTATYDYDAVGALRATAGTLLSEYRFTGQQDDPALGMQYLRARYYDPATGRLLSKDPVPGIGTSPQTQHSYVYGQNNPVNLIDPSGRFAEEALQLVREMGPMGSAAVVIGGITVGPEAVLVAGGVVVMGGIAYVVATNWDNIAYLTRECVGEIPRIASSAQNQHEQAKSREQKASEVDVWNEATKGLSPSEKTRLHNRLKNLKIGRNADPDDILDEREALFPDKPYPGGWLTPRSSK